jgi:hypothetical protein
VSGLTNITAVAAGYNHSFAIRNDGTVWAWKPTSPASIRYCCGLPAPVSTTSPPGKASAPTRCGAVTGAPTTAAAQKAARYARSRQISGEEDRGRWLRHPVAWVAAVGVLGPDSGSTSTQTVPAPSATVTMSASTSATPTWTPPSPKVTPGSVMALALDLPVGEPDPSGYDRDEFGQKWADVDGNGCDQRNDVLRRDTKKRHTKPGTDGCVLQSGVIKNDRYSYASRQVRYERGSSKVEIDHVVSLADAWRMGAYDWSANEREKFANDFMNLEAIDAATDRAKDDKSAAEWLPEAEPTDICWFVFRQVTIKTRYHLAVTQDEKTEMLHGLSSGLCDGNQFEPPPPSTFKAPKPKPIGEPKPKPEPEPEPRQTQEPKLDRNVYYKNCAAARAAGAAPVHRGDPGYARHLDRDGDGVGCE